MTLITIPIRLKNEANSNKHWSKKVKDHQTQKMLVRAFMPSKPPSPPCIVLLTRHAPRPFDSDNLQMAFKWIRDELAGILLHHADGSRVDNDYRIQWHYAQKKTIDKEYFITIEIEPVPSFQPVAPFCPVYTLDSSKPSNDQFLLAE